MAPNRAVMASTVLTLLSGALMVGAGVVIARHGWVAAQWLTVPAGVIIEAALVVTLRADRATGRPRPGARRSLAQRAVALVSGAVMAFAGYCLATWSWLLLAPVSTVGGLLILVAFAVGRGGRVWPPPSLRRATLNLSSDLGTNRTSA